MVRWLLTIGRAGAVVTQLKNERIVTERAHYGGRFQRSPKEARQERPHKVRIGQQCCDASHVLSICLGQGKPQSVGLLRSYNCLISPNDIKRALPTIDNFLDSGIIVLIRAVSIKGADRRRVALRDTGLRPT